MPLYEYACRKCDHTFEALVFGDEAVECPECQGKRRPLLGETVVGPWHNEKTARKDQPQFVWGLGGPTLPDKDGNFD